MPPRAAHERLWDIVEAGRRIQAHDAALAAVGEELAEHLFKDAVQYQLVVIGEAVAALPKEVTDLDPDIPWRAINGLRNRLAHEYFRIEPKLISEVVSKDIAELIARVTALAQRLSPSSAGD